MITRGIGELRERVTLLAPTRTLDGGGGAEIAYEEADTVWASSTDLAGRADRVAGRYAFLARRRYTIRERSELTAEHRLRQGGRVFRITGLVRMGGRKPYQTLTTEEVR